MKKTANTITSMFAILASSGIALVALEATGYQNDPRAVLGAIAFVCGVALTVYK